MEWFGLGKNRSKLGKWLDRRGVSQSEVSKITGVSRPTITRLCSDGKYEPNLSTAKKIIKGLRNLDPNVKSNDFWDL
ncbi:helix-turn-helix transcriptional regulator [Bacillus sp. ISL-57]|uniref:helix-turn-helix domain-containing protein n=1 Tax=Bacillus sp. ISL-57 TaxID=2819135 RepID=UPI001BE79B6E|nr:helix-turn-helix transcriptional regulator [Bacillus sp. ISL-57]MBT2718312.1 helix-turn-helix transcriptional regulator [Bacillus sp. ISL-57]